MTEKWHELSENGYWEKRSNKTFAYQNGSEVVQKGFNEYKNNLNFFEAEQWQEMKDGRILKKRLHDDGFGKKTLSEYGVHYQFPNYKPKYNKEGLFE